MSQFVDFKAVKAAVSLLQVLKRYGLAEKFKQSGDSLSGPCPLHDGENQTQFRISISKNCWHCFGRCNRGGNVLEFVSEKEEVSLRQAALLLVDWFALPKSGKADQSEKRKVDQLQSLPSAEKAKAKVDHKVTSDAPNRPLGFQLKNLDVQHPYLHERGITKKCIAEFGVGYCEQGSMKGRVVIPVHNKDGQLVAYAGRWPGTLPDEDTPKYKLPPGFKKAQELFNVHRAFAEPDTSPLVIVEGFFDCMTLWQQGIRRVVALMGSSLSSQQEETIAQKLTSQSRIVLLLDEDEAGREARGKITPRLANHCYVRTIRFEEEGQQPDSLTAKQLEELRL